MGIREQCQIHANQKISMQKNIESNETVVNDRKYFFSLKSL